MTPLLLTADWHLDRAAWGRHPDATGDSLYALRQIVDHAARLDCPVIAAGDVFDTAEPDSATVHAAVGELDRLGLPVYFVQGQHERASPPWLALSPHAVHLHARRVRLDGITIAGWDYCPDLSEAKSFLLNDPVDLFVTHQVFAEVMLSSVRSTGRLADIPPTVVRVVSGDYHQHRVTSHARYQAPDVELISPGSTHFRSVNEPPLKAVYHLDAQGRLHTLPLDTRPVRQFKAHTDDELAAIVAASDDALFGPCPSSRPADLNRPVVHVRVGRLVTDASDRLRARFPTAHLHVTPIPDSEVPGAAVETPTRRVGSELALQQCLSELPMSAPVAADARRILVSDHPGDTVADIYNRLVEAK